MVKAMLPGQFVLQWQTLDPEITYEEATTASTGYHYGHRAAVINSQPGEQMYSGFPYIFRGALDVQNANQNTKQ